MIKPVYFNKDSIQTVSWYKMILPKLFGARLENNDGEVIGAMYRGKLYVWKDASLEENN